MEYGWGGCLESAQSGGSDPDSIMIFEWKPPLPPMVSSPLDEMAQLAMLRRHTDELNNEMDSHKDYKRKIEAKVSFSSFIYSATAYMHDIVLRINIEMLPPTPSFPAPPTLPKPSQTGKTNHNTCSTKLSNTKTTATRSRRGLRCANRPIKRKRSPKVLGCRLSS